MPTQLDFEESSTPKLPQLLQKETSRQFLVMLILNHLRQLMEDKVVKSWPGALPPLLHTVPSRPPTLVGAVPSRCRRGRSLFLFGAVSGLPQKKIPDSNKKSLTSKRTPSIQLASHPQLLFPPLPSQLLIRFRMCRLIEVDPKGPIWGGNTGTVGVSFFQVSLIHVDLADC